MDELLTRFGLVARRSLDSSKAGMPFAPRPPCSLRIMSRLSGSWRWGQRMQCRAEGRATRPTYATKWHINQACFAECCLNSITKEKVKKCQYQCQPPKHKLSCKMSCGKEPMWARPHICTFALQWFVGESMLGAMSTWVKGTVAHCVKQQTKLLALSLEDPHT